MAETSSNYRQPSSPSISSPTSAPYYGLATQLRTPPTDFSPSFPMTKSSSSTSNNISTSPSLPSKKLTPAMRDEFGFAPKYVPQWSSKGENRSGNEDVWVGGGSEEGTPQSLAPLPRSSPKQSRASGRHSTAPRPMHAPQLSTSMQKHARNDSLRDTPVFGKVDFNFKPMQQPLDLTVTLDPVQSTTYRTSYENKSMPNVQRNFRIDEQDEMPMPTNTLPTRGGSLSSRHKSSRQTDSSLKSPSLESAASRKFQAPPSPSSRPPPPILPDSFAAAFPLSRTITPASKGAMNLITLARRTTHLAEVPGYGWRLNLLEKLEVLTGSFIAIRDAESILSIGQGQKTAPAPSKLESRKSQIFLPTTTTTSESSKLTKSRPTKAKEEPKSFFGKMRRALSNPGSPHTKDTPPPVPPPKRVVFGQKLSQVAEYAFVTSMIAGQRHDLPGVCFSSVEEIYRRGQGSKVPGLLQLAGEPGRVSRLVQIFDAGPDYGEHHDLSVESIHNVCSLLKKYLHDLPEPVLDERVYRLFLAGCVDSTNPLSRRVASAQIILRLLPTANFSLLVYLVAFLSQVPLFPSNPLTLEVVSEIFASSIMAPRQPPSATSTHGKKPKGQMIITGPTDLVDDIDGKKANQGLAWLLKNWSAVADGLLEPDFDIDVDSIVAACSPIVPQASPQPELVQQLAPPTPTSPTMARNFEMPSTPRAAPTPPNGGFSTFPPPPIPFVEPVSEVSEEQASAPMSDVPRYLNSLDDDEEDDEPKSDEEMVHDQSQTKTPRPQSDSSYATSIETPPAGDFGDHRASMKHIEPAQLSPEDERGPLDLSHNTGDDVVEFDDYSSVYSFPAPPTSLPSTTYHHRLPSLPPSPFLTQDEIALALAEQEKAVHSATIPQSSTFAPLQHYDEAEENDEQTEDLDLSSSTMSPAPPQAISPVVDLKEFEPKRLSVSNLAAPHLVRSKSTQLEESRTLVLQQRMEIQSLWEKLTGLESERLREREEMIGLTNEVEGFKQSLRKQVDEVNGGEQLRAELEHVREELRVSEEERKKEQVKAKEQVESLEKQLADIRKVLIPLLGSSIQV